MNIIEKILAKASGKREVAPGDIVEASVDIAMFHDLTGPLTIETFRKIGIGKVWDPSKIVVVFDHEIPPNNIRIANFQKEMRKFIKQMGIKNFYDIGKGGVCHQVLPEKGFVRPGSVIVGADSHTVTYGALGAFATGIGATDMAAVLATGKLWFKVPEVIGVKVHGALKPYVMAKDLILTIIGKIGADGATYKGVEFFGETINNLSIDGRLCVCNMSIEMGAKAGIIAPDEKTIEYLSPRAGEASDINWLRSDEGSYSEIVEIDSSKIEPVVSCPPSVDRVKPVNEIGDVEVDQAFIGSCTNGRLEDLRIAAKILKGRKVKNGTRLIIIPASQEIMLQAIKEGLIEIFVRAGAIVGGMGCGPCLGRHTGVLGDDEVCISSSNRNFIGRMGSPKAKVYLASPATVAASAVAGRIENPKEFLN